MTENNAQSAECLSRLTAELDTISDENGKEFFGWCVLDKYGVSRHVIPTRRHFFGCIDIKEAIDEPDEVLKEFDRDCAGLAPHKICKLYIGV
jgi:predicted 3-demethylubiquinone-9 3-methyltransferase (glyoxalase superfamily)